MKSFIAAALLLAVPALANPNVRSNRQQARINQGVATGELNGREAARLQRSENRIQTQITRDRIDGGGLSAAERVKLDRQQDRLNKRIYSQKHDGQGR